VNSARMEVLEQKRKINSCPTELAEHCVIQMTSKKVMWPLSSAFFFLTLIVPIQFSALDSKERATDDFQIGLKFLRFARYDSAIHRLENRLKYQADFSEVFVPLGMACLFAGRFDQALSSFQEALVKDNRNPDAHVGVGHFYYAKAGLRDKNMFLDVRVLTENQNLCSDDTVRLFIQKGVEAYTKVIEINPRYRSDIWHDPDCACSEFNSVDLHNSLGCGYWMLGNIALAKKEFESAHSLDANDADSATLLELLNKHSASTRKNAKGHE